MTLEADLERTGTVAAVAAAKQAMQVAASPQLSPSVVATDPAAGTAAWNRVLADPIDCSTTPVACVTEQIIASDRTGVHTLDSSTEFEAQTGPQLTGLTLTTDLVSWSHAGTPRAFVLKP